MSRRQTKQTFDGQRCVNINTLIRDGFIRSHGSSWETTWSNWHGSPIVVLKFTYRGSGALDMRQPCIEVVNSAGRTQTVNIVRKPVGLAASRQHFLCPVPKCEKCVDALYVANFVDYDDGLGCRHCLELIYGPRPARRLMNLRERHGMGLDPLSYVIRPKGMHERTYLRLRSRLGDLTMRWMRSVPTFADLSAKATAEIRQRDAELETVIEALRRLPENAEATYAELEAFEERYRHLGFDPYVNGRIAESFPPSPPVRRVDGGTGSERRYRPPRPASRRRSKSACLTAT